MKSLILILFFVGIIGISYFFLPKDKSTIITPAFNKNTANPLEIATMRQKLYPGSNISIEQELAGGSNYKRYLVSYQSDGLKQYALLALPIGQKPPNGWPVILFNHGYIPPLQYSTDTSYASFISPLASAGYIVFKPDYRGNGNSQGLPSQIYVSADYVTDSMNALSSIKRYADVNPDKIGVFGHSMGGNITLHQLVISKDIKAAEIMSGVVGDETGIINWWQQRIAKKSIVGNDLDTSYVVQQMIIDHGTPDKNPDYWNRMDPTKYIKDITAPVQIQVGTNDTAVLPNFSLFLRDVLQNTGKTVDYHVYSGADHNLSPVASAALTETIAFFDKYLK